MNKQFVSMEHVIGTLAFEYNIPILELDDLILLGKRAVIVYDLDKYAKKITFHELCEYICTFIKTPFGLNLLKQLSIKI